MLTDPIRVNNSQNHVENGNEENLHVLPAKPTPEHAEANQSHSPGGNIGDQRCTAQSVVWKTADLRPLVAYERLGLQPSMRQLSSIAALGESAFADPLVVTQDGSVVDGYARLEMARRAGRPTLPCLQYELTPDEGLVLFLQRHRRIPGLNAFCRISLALELEPYLRQKARSNQQLGGRMKGSSILTKAECVDVRREIARVAGASPGNVSKVKRILASAAPALLAALMADEVSINWAWLLVREPAQDQQEALDSYRQTKYMRTQIGHLISQHFKNSAPSQSSLQDFSDGLATLSPEHRREIIVIRLQMPGKVVAVSSGVVKLLKNQKEMDLE